MYVGLHRSFATSLKVSLENWKAFCEVDGFGKVAEGFFRRHEKSCSYFTFLKIKALHWFSKALFKPSRAAVVGQ